MVASAVFGALPRPSGADEVLPQEPLIPFENQDLADLRPNLGEREITRTKPEYSSKDAEHACKTVQS
jgi:hypothetical protein